MELSTSSLLEGRIHDRPVRRSALTPWSGALTAGMITLLSATTPAAAGCHMVRFANLDATLEDNTPLVPATVDSQPVQMVLETAYTRTQMSRSAAKDLHLKLHPSAVTFHDPDGADDVADMARLSDFTFLGATSHQLPLYVTSQVATTGHAAGAIGEDMLSQFDVEFDLGSGKIRFFTSVDCKGDQVAYWAQGYFVANLTHTTDTDLPLVEVTLNGQKVLAAFSSGTPQSTITARALQLSGIKPEATGQGVAGQPGNSAVVVIPSITIGQETLENAKLKIAGPGDRYGLARAESQLDHRAFVEPDVEIGGDFFLQHRIYFSRSQKKVYFTYNGTPKPRTAGLSTRVTAMESNTSIPSRRAFNDQ